MVTNKGLRYKVWPLEWIALLRWTKYVKDVEAHRPAPVAKVQGGSGGEESLVHIKSLGQKNQLNIGQEWPCGSHLILEESKIRDRRDRKVSSTTIPSHGLSTKEQS